MQEILDDAHSLRRPIPESLMDYLECLACPYCERNFCDERALEQHLETTQAQHLLRPALFVREQHDAAHARQGVAFLGRPSCFRATHLVGY